MKKNGLSILFIILAGSIVASEKEPKFKENDFPQLKRSLFEKQKVKRKMNKKKKAESSNDINEGENYFSEHEIYYYDSDCD